MYALWMTLKWIRRWARFLDVKLRLDHTLSQSTDKLRSDNSLFQIVLIERGFVIQSRILLYIKETDGRPADGAIQSRIGWEEMEEDQGTHTLWEQNVIEEKQNMQMLVDKIWLSMPEMNRGPGYHTYHRTCSHLKRTKRVGQMDDFHIQSSNCAIKVYCYRIWRVPLSDVQPFSRF